jgi:hypothetical protein
MFGFFGFKGSDQLCASTIQRCKALTPSHNLFGQASKTFDFWPYLAVKAQPWYINQLPIIYLGNKVSILEETRHKK